MTVHIEFSDDEALVLFEWLSRENESTTLEFDDQAEQRVLWDLLAQLEKTLTAPLSPDYKALLAKARAAVRDTERPS
jgi:hypothetical protein